jgi:hypothetical protein
MLDIISVSHQLKARIDCDYGTPLAAIVTFLIVQLGHWRSGQVHTKSMVIYVGLRASS